MTDVSAVHDAAPVRVLFVSRSFPPSVGGIERHNQELLDSLRRLVDVRAVVNRRGRSFLPVFYVVALLRSLVVARRVDVVLLGDGVLAPLGLAVRALTGTPVCSVVHGLDLTYPNRAYQAVFVGALLRLDRILAVSNETKRRAVARGADPARCRRIPNGVHVPVEAMEATTTERVDDHEHPRTILTVGRLVERKGIAWFVEHVVPQLPADVRYVVAGDGPERAAIESAVRSLDTPGRVEVLGRVAETEKWRLMREAHAFVQPNIPVAGDMEGFGIVVLEAAAMALPVVAADLEGLRDAITHGENGLLVPTRDVTGFVDALTELVDDPDRAATLGQRARQVVLERFQWEAIARTYAAELREVVTEASRPGCRADGSTGLGRPRSMSATMTRSEFVEAIRGEIRDRGVALAIQGASGALDVWCRSTGPGDLDLWTTTDDADEVARMLQRLGGRQVAATRDEGWLRHDQYACLLEGGPAVVDVTVGDLRVGSIRLCPEGEVTTTDHGRWPRLSGWAAVADLALRPLLRGRQPSNERLTDARTVWAALDDPECKRRIDFLREQIGGLLARRIRRWLDGGPPLSRRYLGYLRVRMAAAALASRRTRRAAWNHRTELVRGLPVLERGTGTLVVMLGTDGAGKTATSTGLLERLRALEVPASVRYFGRGRGNLPGVAHVRRLLESRKVALAERAPTGDEGQSSTGSVLRRAAAWYYVLEYALRYWFLVHPRLIRGDTVILDRYVHDLWIMDPMSPAAARLATRVVPRPDVLVHLDPPLDVILRRKQERTPATAAHQQAVYRRLLRERPADVMTISVTGVLPLDELSDAVTNLVVPIIFRRQVDQRVRRRRFPTPATIAQP